MLAFETRLKPWGDRFPPSEKILLSIPPVAQLQHSLFAPMFSRLMHWYYKFAAIDLATNLPRAVAILPILPVGEELEPIGEISPTIVTACLSLGLVFLTVSK